MHHGVYTNFINPYRPSVKPALHSCTTCTALGHWVYKTCRLHGACVKLLFICTYVYYNLISITVISEPDNVTVCKGKSTTTLTCLLDGSITSGDVQWYSLLKDTSTTEMVDQRSNIRLTTSTNINTTNSSLTITNATKSYTGYYWVRLSSDVCNVSLTVLDAESMYVNRIHCNCTYTHFE